MPLPPAVALRKRIHTRSIALEGVRGCAHLTELLLGLPATAIQTFASEMRDTDGHDPLAKPFQLDRCHALDTSSDTVRRYYPRWYRGPKTGS